MKIIFQPTETKKNLILEYQLDKPKIFKGLLDEQNEYKIWAELAPLICGSPKKLITQGLSIL